MQINYHYFKKRKKQLFLDFNSCFFLALMAETLTESTFIEPYIISYQNVIRNYNWYPFPLPCVIIISYQNVIRNYNAQNMTFI